MRNSQKVMQAMKQILEENQAKPTQMYITADFHTKEQLENNPSVKGKVVLVPGDSPVKPKNVEAGS